MASSSSTSAAAAFADRWLHEPGNEKQQTAAFWSELLHNVLGIDQPTELIRFEYPVKCEGVTRYIDAYLPEPRVLIEQKSADVDLAAHAVQSGGTELSAYRQAKRYADNLPFNRRPRWILTCNFREIRIHDMDLERPEAEPVIITLQEIPAQVHALRFLTEGVSETARIEKEKQLSIQAGELISRIYNALLARCPEPLSDGVLQQLNRFCVRLVFCLYADDAGLFAKGQFLDYLHRSSDPDGKSALVLKLFRALNLPPAQRDPFDTALRAFPHVNGGLFAGVEKDYMPLFDAELCSLIEDEAAAGFNWADISPTIFGGLFESTINPKTRRMGGMHYTSVENIHKVIDPLFLDDLKAELAAILAKKEKSGTARARKLKAYCAKLASLTFLDPACGSGNFLTETFISLRRLENEALQNLADGQGSLDLGALVSINQFYGIEINDFAVAVAKTALWIAAAQMWKKTQEFTTKELPDFLPLESYDNIREANALAVDWTENVPGHHIDYIISNPPFVGYSHKTPEQRNDMQRTLGHLRAWGKIDYVGAWFHKAAQLMQTDPATRAAFVATNSIVQGEQASSLWKPLMTDLGAHILFAYRSFKWMNEAENTAAVHCVVVAISAQKPAHCTIFDETGTPHRAAQINNYLLDAPSVFVENRTRPLCDVPVMTTGNRPADGGHLIIEAADYEDFIAKEPRAEQYIKRFMGAEEFIQGAARYCLWLVDVPPDVLRAMPRVMARIAACKADRLASPDLGRRKLADTPALFRETNNPDSFIVVPRVTSENRAYIPMTFCDASVIASDATLTIPDATLYHFGVLTSAMHMAWMRTVAGRLKSDYRYSAGVVYNNFPWPSPTGTQREKIESAAQAVLDTRAKYPNSTLADLYDPLLMPPDLRRAHRALDATVDAAYGRKFADEAARVAHLFALYTKISR